MAPCHFFLYRFFIITWCRLLISQSYLNYPFNMLEIAGTVALYRGILYGNDHMLGMPRGHPNTCNYWSLRCMFFVLQFAGGKYHTSRLVNHNSIKIRKTHTIQAAAYNYAKLISLYVFIVIIWFAGFVCNTTWKCMLNIYSFREIYWRKCRSRRQTSQSDIHGQCGVL